MLKQFVFILLFGFQHISFSQDDIPLDKFSVEELNGVVSLSITISSGNICNGVQFYRSTDSLNYELIGQIQGYCGSISEPISYQFTDEHPVKNTRNYYRVNLGGYGYSNVISVDIIDLNKSGYQIRPNPASENVSIYFENKFKNNRTIYLYDLKGNKFYQNQTTEKYVNFNVTNIPNGLYVFVIFDEKNQLMTKGKLLIQK